VSFNTGQIKYAMKKIAFVLVWLQCTVLANVKAQRTISVDYNKVSGELNTMFKTCVGGTLK
jgi:xylan 1,4-beta-xylosidase